MRAVINLPPTALPVGTSSEVRVAFRSAGYHVHNLRLRSAPARSYAARFVLSISREGTYNTEDWARLAMVCNALNADYIDLVPYGDRGAGIRIGGTGTEGFKPEQFIYTTDYED